MIQPRGFLLALLLPVAAAVGCGGSGGHGSGSTAAALSTASVFSLLATTPMDGEQGVDPALTLYATFAGDVDPTSLAPGALTLVDDNGPVSVSLALVGSGVVAVQPQGPLAPQLGHLLTVTTLVRGTGGETLPADVRVRFQTGHPAVGGGGASGSAQSGPYQAGAAAVDVTPPVGVPLAGYGGGARRRSFPDLNPFNDYTFLQPSTGTHDPIQAKALVVDNGHERVCLVTLDAIACDADVLEESWRKASAQGFSLPLERVMACASHSHSGPGALSRRTFWQLTAADLRRQRVVDGFTDGVARAMLAAEQALGPALIGFASRQLTTATENRRAPDSPDLDPDDIDPELIAIRVDRPDGTPVATVWSFPIHGTIFGTQNHLYSADVMGSAAQKIEAAGGGVALFLNGAEGDIRPVGDWDGTGRIVADAVLAARQAATTSAAGVVHSQHEVVDLGQPYIEWTPARNGGVLGNAGWMQALSALGFKLHIDLPRGWVEREFRFQAVHLGGSVIASLPGEPIHLLGLELKRDGRALGYEHVIPACLGNGYGSYFTTPAEYGYGGYEGLASFFGPDNGQKLLAPARRLMQAVR